MIPPIAAIPSSLGPKEANAAGSSAGGPSGGGGFANILGNAIDQANGVQQNATDLALQGATGQASIADVTVAATEAQLSVQLITTVRDKAVDALNSIMSMTT
jgi:flagellar hook-basal body complex protein FliE